MSDHQFSKAWRNWWVPRCALYLVAKCWPRMCVLIGTTWACHRSTRVFWWGQDWVARSGESHAGTKIDKVILTNKPPRPLGLSGSFLHVNSKQSLGSWFTKWIDSCLSAKCVLLHKYERTSVWDVKKSFQSDWRGIMCNTTTCIRQTPMVGGGGGCQSCLHWILQSHRVPLRSWWVI